MLFLIKSNMYSHLSMRSWITTKTLELHRTLVHPTRQAALMRKQFLPIALFLLFFLGMAWIQFVTPDMPDNDGFYWLQATSDPDVAFLVTDPQPFFKDYDVPIREETQQDLHLADTKDGRVMVICNRVGEWLTGNLMGPLVVNTVARLGQQMVLTEKTWSHRQPLVKVGLGQQTVRAAAA